MAYRRTPLPARLPKENVPRTYSFIAPFHDLLARLVEAEARRDGLRWAGVQNGETVLEVGVGTGLTFQSLLAANLHGWTEGLDLSPAMLRRARKKASRVETDRYRLQSGDAYDLPFSDSHFDLLWCSYMFDLLPEADFLPVLAEFCRVLRPGGRVVLVNETYARRWYNQLWDGIYRLHPALMGGCRGVALTPYLPDAGFTRVRCTYVSQFTFPSEIVYGERPAA